MAVKNVQVPAAGITPTSAQVIWETDTGEENTDDGVRFGTASLTNDTGAAPNPSGTTSHAVTITGLTPGTAYLCQPYSQVRGVDLPCATGNCQLSFSTPAAAAQPGLSLQISRTDLRVGENATVTATLIGSNGQPQAGVRLDFTHLDPISVARALFSPSSAVTGANGQCQSVFTLTGRRFSGVSAGPAPVLVKKRGGFSWPFFFWLGLQPPFEVAVLRLVP